MRTIEKHKVEGARSNLEVVELERNIYQIALPAGPLVLDFTAGLTNEALLAVVFDRAEKQKTELFDGRVGGALLHMHRAIEQLKRRTEGRIAAGVEGTNQVEPDNPRGTNPPVMRG